MSSGLKKFTDNIAYRANIFNYDSKFFDEFSNSSLQFLDLEQNKEPALKKVSEDIKKYIAIFSKPVNEQLNLFNTLVYYLNESNEESSQKVTKDAKQIIQTIIDAIQNCHNVLKQTEEERLKNQETWDTGVTQAKKQYAERLLANITYCLLFLDGLIMQNVEISGVYELLSQNVGINFDDLMNTLLASKELNTQQKEVVSHIYSASIVFASKAKDASLYKAITKWTISYNESIETKRDNCYTSNMCLLLSNDIGLQIAIEEFKTKVMSDLYGILSKDYSINTVYEALLCVWNFTYNENYITVFENRDEKLVEKIIQVIKSNKVEKIVRIGSQIIKVSLLFHLLQIRIYSNQKNV